jgi:hypothetical protein
MGQFKNNDLVKVTGEESKHLGKVGMITDQFQLKGMERLNVIHFSDDSTSTIKDTNLEKIDMDGYIIQVPSMPKVSSNVYITESGGMVHVYTSGNVVYGEPPEGYKDRCAKVHIPIPPKPSDNTSWIRKDGDTVFIHCPGEVKSMKPIPMPAGVDVVAFSPICK